MEEFQEKVSIWWAKAVELAQAMTLEEWGIAGGGFVVLLLFRWIIKRSKRSKKITPRSQNITQSPVVKLYSFQIAPLGRDAFLKVQNTGELATLTKLEILGRDNIRVRNAVAGHKLAKGKIYSILLEATGPNKIKDGFEVKITYMNSTGKVAVQSFIALQKENKN